MPLISDYIENVYSSIVLEKFTQLLTPLGIPSEDIHVDFESGITLTGLQVLKEKFHELVADIPAVSGTKTMIIQEVIDPRGANDLGCSAQLRYVDVMGYYIYTEVSRSSLFVWLWNTGTKLVYPLKAEVDADDKNA